MAETQPIALIVGVACSLVALVLAWRAYRSAAEEHEQRKRERNPQCHPPSAARQPYSNRKGPSLRSG